MSLKRQRVAVVLALYTMTEDLAGFGGREGRGGGDAGG